MPATHLRRSFAIGLQRLGVAPHLVELVLNHRSGTLSGVAGIYSAPTRLLPLGKDLPHDWQEQRHFLNFTA